MSIPNNVEYKDPEPGEIESYLESKGLQFFIKGDEINFPCPHGDCDTDREHPNRKDFHCSINSETGQYHCVKCGSSGNLTTLKRLLGDNPATGGENKSGRSYASTLRNPEKIANACHQDMSKNHREYIDYFMGRKISLLNINTYRLGCLELNGKMWLTIPIVEGGVCTYLKLRRPPEDDERDPKYKFYPKGVEAGVFGGDELLRSSSDSVMVCGGELDKIIAEQMDFGMPVISGTTGENDFKDAWVNKYLQNRRNIYICFDADEAGHKATEALAEKLKTMCPNASIFKVVIPEDLSEHADLTDANKAGITAKELLESVEFIGGAKPIDVNQFREMTTRDLAKVLSLTIKRDNANKVIIFLAMLSTYTEESQLNVFLNARSSSGKSYIVQEVSKYFPQIDILDFCKVTPTAFYYNEGCMRTDENGKLYLDLERKILIFYDQVDSLLQAKIRGLLSHDKKKLPFLNTNKSKNGANTAKDAYFLGYPSAFFCSANMKMDEQEQTRAFLLSPEITQDKIGDGVDLVELKMSNKSAFKKMLDENTDRQLLIDRVLYIKGLMVDDVNIPAEFGVAARFKKMCPRLEPRAQRDISHLGSLIKAIALLNAPFRKMSGQNLVATKNDVDQAFELWEYLNRSQKYGISPQALDFYTEIIIPAYNEKTASGIKGVSGVTLRDLNCYSVKVTGSTLNLAYCRNQFVPVLEAAGLISYEKNPENKKERLIVPLDLSVGQPQQDVDEANTEKESDTPDNMA